MGKKGLDAYLKNIIIDNNRFYNCGDDRGNNGVIGADYGDYITVSNNSFMSIKGRMGAVIGLNHNYSVSIINNNIEVSDKCPMNSNIVKLNSSNISNVKVIRNRVDFSKTGKKSDKLVSASYAVQEIVVKDNNVIGGNSIEVIDIPKAVHKYVSGNKVKLK